jgi:hypothetical protein
MSKKPQNGFKKMIKKRKGTYTNSQKKIIKIE